MVNKIIKIFKKHQETKQEWSFEDLLEIEINIIKKAIEISVSNQAPNSISTISLNNLQNPEILV